MASKEELRKILEKIKITGRIDEGLFYNISDEEMQLIKDLQNEGLVNEALDLLNEIEVEKEWSLFLKKIPTKTKVTPLWKNVLRYAALLVGICFILYVIAIGEKADPDSINDTITLKTGNNTVKFIKEGESQEIVSSTGEVLGVQNGNKLSYKGIGELNELIYNELEIPYGKVFDLEFSDGTIVHLNSGSKIKYPVKFLKDFNREVFIEGEAYFKVAKDKTHPFIVHADEVTVEVLGTEFNITSYKEDMDIKTVLVEGSVSMSHASNQEGQLYLKPGDKATWNKSESTSSIEQVDVDMYIGWINGELIFRNESFENMAKRLERKYKVEIHNRNLLLAEKKLNARFNVNIESIEDVLNTISEIQKFEYQISNGKVIID